MVKHGRNKKRRAGRIGRTKLKNNSFRRWDPKPKIVDAVVRQHWDPSKSPSVNLANLGLLARPNDDAKNIAPSERIHPNKNVNIVELFDIPDSDELREQKRQRRCPLEEEDQKYIVKCLAKYGDDYGKAFRDTKVNYMQHTENQLRKMGARFLLLNAEQRVVPVPEKVKPLLESSMSTY
jgi:Ribosome biogenesis protein Nop16